LQFDNYNLLFSRNETFQSQPKSNFNPKQAM